MDEQKKFEWPSIVPRSTIPVSLASEDAGLEVRPFLAHRVLRGAVSQSAVTLAWTHAKPHQDVPLRSHPTPGLLIVLRGKAELVGTTTRGVEQGDVITLPSNHQYGLTGVGPDGFHALYLAFRKDASLESHEVSTLSQLLRCNDARLQRSLVGPYFGMLRTGVLSSPRTRARFRDCARVFSDAFQQILFTRRATCRDEEFGATFQVHMMEELGHNELLTVPETRRGPTDPILRATSDWFCHQMLVLDNVEKAVVHLVLETAGFHFHTLAQPLLADDVSAGYFDTHSEADDDHKDVVLHLLAGQHPHTYRRLHRVLEDAWDLFDAMTRRIVQLVELEAMSS